MLHHKSGSECGEIIHVRQILACSTKSRSVGEIIHVLQILAELWSLTLRIFTHFSLSSQLLIHVACMELNETFDRVMVLDT